MTEERTEDRNGSTDSEATAPDIRRIIQDAIRDEGLATHADFVELNQRVGVVEATLAEIPAKYASAEAVRKVASSQAEYETSRQKLTVQVGELANLLVDNQSKFSTIEQRMNELSTMKNLLTTFMDTQRERLDNQQISITEAKQKTDDLAKEVAFVKTTQVDAEQRYNTGFKPVHDFIIGSDTHKPLMVVIDGFGSRLDTMAQQLTPAVEYIAEQKKREAERRSFWQSVRLQMWTWRGVLSMLLALVVILMVVNSINFDQLFERIRQLAEAIGLLRNAVKGT